MGKAVIDHDRELWRGEGSEEVGEGQINQEESLE